MKNPFKYFKTSPENHPAGRNDVHPLSLRRVEDVLFERGINICHETARYGWNRFGPLFAAEIRTRRVHHGSYPNWRWHLDEVFVRINGKTCYLWRAVDHEGEVLTFQPKSIYSDNAVADMAPLSFTVPSAP